MTKIRASVNSKSGLPCAMLQAPLGVSLVMLIMFWGAQKPASSSPSVDSLTRDFAAKLHTERTSPSDLEIGGELAGLPPNTVRYITRDALLALKQSTSRVTDDSNFKSPVTIGGVLLFTLAQALAAHPDRAMVIATCKDNYQAHYPRDYVLAHNPILVLTIDSQSPAQWSSTTTLGFDPGPYLISHPHFTPRFKILSQSEVPQIPWGVVRLDFNNEKSFLAPIKPQGYRAGDKSVRAGYQIAEQNCLRCHYNGTTGGTKSGVGWRLLANLAAHSPQFFSEYVRHPERKNPHTQMEGSPGYDDETVKALIEYFKTFEPADKQ